MTFKSGSLKTSSLPVSTNYYAPQNNTDALTSLRQLLARQKRQLTEKPNFSNSELAVEQTVKTRLIL
ncbi:MAG: hypothetical protein AAFX01_07105 [Cyanobacteria bacterium J06638_28]